MLGRLAKVEVNQRASSSEVEALKNFALNVGLKKNGDSKPFFVTLGLSLQNIPARDPKQCGGMGG